MKKLEIFRLLNGYGRNIPDKYFDQYELERGTNVELEHTSNKIAAKIIAKQHLAEFPKYYIYLERMESLLKQDEEMW